MFSRWQKLLLLFLSLLSLSLARPEISNNVQLQRRAEKHPGRGGCFASRKLTKRTLEARWNLVPRAFPSFPSDQCGQDTFMVNEVNSAQNLIADPGGNRDFFNTAIFHQLGTDNIEFGVKKLKGCGVLIIASENAVYGAHFYEELSFPDEMNPEDDEDLDPDLQGQVIQLLDSGRNDPGLPAGNQVPLRPHINDFKDVKGLQAWYIVGKLKNGDYDGKEAYPKSNAAVIKKIKDDIGIEPQKVTYECDVLGEQDDLENVAEGRVLFQYDPNQGSGPQHRSYRVIAERTILDKVHEW